jgi:hypothetical protein
VDIEWVARLATSFPQVRETTQWSHRTWQVAGKSFVWERPFTNADIKRFGDGRVPDGPIIAIRTEDLHDKAAVLASEPPGAFDIEHFKNYPAYLVELSLATEGQVRELVTDGWLAVAPERLAREFLGE